MDNVANDAENRVLATCRIVKAPIDLVWAVWTQPGHIVNWWGPNGFTNTIHKMDLQKGGEWNLTMHGPDGKNYPNQSVFIEIIPFEKIIFEHFNPHFITTVCFEPKGNATRIDWSLLFDSPEMFDIVVRTHKADEGQKQNLDKLEKYLSSRAS